MQFQKAVKYGAKLRLALIGPAGSGKTYSALNVAQHLGERVAMLDTEHGSASKYADQFSFDTLQLITFSPTTYVQAIKMAEGAGYDVLIIDSLSHAWMGKEGALEQVDQAAKRSRSSNTFVAWRDVTPLHNQLVEAMLASGLHLIVTMRSKIEYAVEKDDKTGKTSVRKIGMAPIQRDGLEYEFDVTGDLDLDNSFIISKTRCPALKGKLIATPGKEIADILLGWLAGEPAPQPPPATNGSPDQKPGISAGNGHGATIDRTKIVDRLLELAEASAEYGQAVGLDATWLAEAPLEELIQAGKELRAKVDALKIEAAKQKEMF